MNYRDNPDWHAHIAGILANPTDDLPRMVAADRLEEWGEVERADLIRVQIRLAELIERTDHEVHATGMCAPYCTDCPEIGRLLKREHQLFEWLCSEDSAADLGLPSHETLYPTAIGLLHPPTNTDFTFDRGFIERVSGPLETLIGGRCVHCPDRAGFQHRLYPGGWERCEPCGGSGVTFGVLDTLLRHEPVASVEVMGREPIQLNTDEGFVFNWMIGRLEPESPYFLPQDVFSELILPHPKIGGEGMSGKFAVTADLAHAALNAAILTVARRRLNNRASAVV